MAFKIVVLAAVLAYANAGLLGAPVAYSGVPALGYSGVPALGYSSPLAYSAPVAVHAPAIGASQQSVVRSLGGNQAVSTYSKAVDSAFSTVRKFDTRVTNDGLLAAPVAVAHAAPLAVAHAAPLAVAHAGSVISAPAAVAYSPAAVVSHATFNGLGVSYGW